MEPPRNLQQVQQLAGRVAALSRFIAKLGENALPFYQLMKKSEKFEWTVEAHETFDNLKKVFLTSPVLVTPHDKEPMLHNIAATSQVVSTVLIVERSEAGKFHGVQRPIYYLSEVLTPAKQRYQHHQKLAYVVWRTARKLQHYFGEHPIIIITEAPLKKILTNPDATGRVSQWAIELAPYDISYINRTTIKSQILPDFFVDWIQSQITVAPDMSGSWTMYFDGSKRSTDACAGVVLVSPQSDKMRYVLRMNFALLTNNEAEYEALLHGMRWMVQVVVPGFSSTILIYAAHSSEVPHKLELEKVWLHVEGVPHTVQHFLGLRVVGSLLGKTMDVDLLSLRRRAVVRIEVAMLTSKVFDKTVDDGSGPFAKSDVVVNLKAYEFRFHRQPEYYVPEPDFVPMFWAKKDDEDRGADCTADNGDDAMDTSEVMLGPSDCATGSVGRIWG
ncbi:hypothetical protein QYE76_026176 [Lolium multiflorum]|uniref:Reverse transcriptase RNase H-like domain-containing protein n=1 Tax=Lolium multiflorum TaxID=4521 RepID=A0AAD8VVC1_LOLMU|nr:hypothetical protein QYE76_026176 [Lolium multiflorum]